MDRDDKHSAHTDSRYASLDDSVIPDAKNLKETLERTLPFLVNKNIQWIFLSRAWKRQSEAYPVDILSRAWKRQSEAILTGFVIHIKADFGQLFACLPLILAGFGFSGSPKNVIIECY